MEEFLEKQIEVKNNTIKLLEKEIINLNNLIEKKDIQHKKDIASLFDQITTLQKQNWKLGRITVLM